MNEGFLVEEEIKNSHPTLQDYPLYPGDLIVLQQDGFWFKEGPGLGVGGFQLTDEQVSKLKPVKFTYYGLSYHIHGEEDPHE